MPMSVKARKNTKKKKEDGAPVGFVYQAESPDEAAKCTLLVSLFFDEVLLSLSSSYPSSCVCRRHLSSSSFPYS